MRHRQLWTAALSAVLVGVMATSALAQAPPGGPGGPGGPGQPGQRGQMRGMMDSSFMVIRMSTVQRHLSLTAAQVEQINALPRMGGGRQGQPGAGPGQGGQAGPGQAGPGQRRQGQAGQAQPGGPGEARPDPLAGILTARQMTRFRQLVAQYDSPMSMLRPENARRLQLTDQQRQQIMEIVRGLMPARTPGQGQAQPGTPPQMQPWPERLRARQNAARQGVALLTAQQRTTWQSIVGAQFTDWEEPQFGRAPGR